ncbi:HlyD family type I secretion periplasmic adaptor subunit [Enterobacter kobei]|uniref:HlyD family type I secretion periplasmic adaptor subunit n=1 Tax=Enterobacter kobei TaxID=208224 RepID=UPI003A9758A2
MHLWWKTIKEFWHRYVRIWANVWQVRDQLTSPARANDDYAFLPAHLELIEKPVSVAPKVVMSCIMAFAILALLWTVIGKVDIVAVSQGKMVPVGRSKTIQSLETSMVKKIYVKDGDTVTAGQLLVELNGVGSDNDYYQSLRMLNAAKLAKYRNKALLNALEAKQSPVIDRAEMIQTGITEKEILASELLAQNQYHTWFIQDQQLATVLQQHKAELRASEAQISKLKNIGLIEKQRLSDFKKLLNKNYLSQHEYYEQESKTIQNSNDLNTQISQSEQIKESINQAEHERNLNSQTLIRDTMDALRQNNEDIEQLTEQMLKTKQRQTFMTLKSPVNGTVQQLATHTVGGVVMEGQTMMVIAPLEDKIEVETLVANKDIGFVRAGQDAVIKIESFPYTRYGYLTGKVKHVSFDAIEHEKLGLVFSAIITLDQTEINIEGTRVPLSAGMNITAEIKTGKRRVIEYLLSPLQTKLDESFKER